MFPNQSSTLESSEFEKRLKVETLVKMVDAPVLEIQQSHESLSALVYGLHICGGNVAQDFLNLDMTEPRSTPLFACQTNSCFTRI